MRQGGTRVARTSKLEYMSSSEPSTPPKRRARFEDFQLRLSTCFVLQAEGNEKRIDEDGDHNDLEDREGPKVTIHSSHGTFDTKEDGSATAYIINGPETNVAAGSGLRGIRWLRGP